MRNNIPQYDKWAAMSFGFYVQWLVAIFQLKRKCTVGAAGILYWIQLNDTYLEKGKKMFENLYFVFKCDCQSKFMKEVNEKPKTTLNTNKVAITIFRERKASSFYLAS